MSTIVRARAGADNARIGRQYGASCCSDAIANVHTVFDADVVLCGPIAGYLDDAEIAQLQQMSAATASCRCGRAQCSASA